MHRAARTLRHLLLGTLTPALLSPAWGQEAQGACEEAQALLAQAAAAQRLEVSVACMPGKGTGGEAGRWALEGPLPALVSGPARVALRPRSREPARALAVPVVLTVRSTAWVARHDIGAGQPLGMQDLARQPIDWPVGVVPASGEELPPQGRARQAIRAGRAVGAAMVAAGDELMQGDPVTLHVRTGAMTIERPAVLVADARVGQMARVQIKGQREVVEAWIAAPTTVVLEHP